MPDLGPFDLKESVAVVTGGCGLLGVEHCAALMELGAVVFIGDINVPKSVKVAKNLNLKGFSGKAIALKLD